MARTKASVGAKVAAGKSSKARCSVAAPPVTAGPSGSSDKTSRSYSGGNSVCPRETPKWQKPITNFFICKDNDSKDSDSDCDESTSKPKPKRNIIHSDDEEQTETPKNKELDETIELEPLTGENSHKIDEYYAKNDENSNNNENFGENNKNSANNVENCGENDKKSANDDENCGKSDENGNKFEENNNGVIKSVKGKGVGKKTKGKENLSDNFNRKREREDNDVHEQTSKRLRVE